jgi:hypothetical protein
VSVDPSMGARSTSKLAIATSISIESDAYLAVDDPAVAPDLSGGAGEHPNVAHPNHGCHEVGVEERGAGAVLPHQRVLRPAVEELLVRVEQAPPRQQVGEVGRVEPHRRLHVDGRQVAVAAGPRARLLPQRREGGVDVGVAVDAAAEGGAPGLPDGVRARQRRHVARRQALPAEQGDERAEAGRRGREVAVGERGAGRRRVPPPERHAPGRPAELYVTYGDAQRSKGKVSDDRRRERFDRPCKLARRRARAYKVGSVARGKREDVGARHDAGARGLDVPLDGVDDLKAAHRVQVRPGGLLPSGVEKDRSVAALSSCITVAYTCHDASQSNY